MDMREYELRLAELLCNSSMTEEEARVLALAWKDPRQQKNPVRWADGVQAVDVNRLCTACRKR